jgi:STE24 endopeptidase
MAKSLAYSEDKFRFGVISSVISIIVLIAFLALGGFGWVEGIAKEATSDYGDVATGVVFFGLLGLGLVVLGLPGQLIRTFWLEEKHGFNRQTLGGFFLDQLKGLAIGAILGGGLIALLLYIMAAAGPLWWLLGWAVVSGFSILTAWLYPTFLAPMFNKFSPLKSSSLQEAINALAEKIGFPMGGVYVMDASKRSSHGNAYFTGVFGKKRIVLFDTLLDGMSDDEVLAVLAHELGHFKLHHVRWGLIRGLAMSLGIFYLLSLMLPYEMFYEAFGFSGVSNYAGLVVFSMWFGLVEFYLNPMQSYLSRRNEFAADRFARVTLGTGAALMTALKKLREKSYSMPLSHPLYSAVYFSHPPIAERITALREF